MAKQKAPTAKLNRLGVRVTPAQKHSLELLAAKRGITPSQVIRDQIQGLTEKHEKLKAANANNANNAKQARIALVHRQIRSLQKELAEL